MLKLTTIAAAAIILASTVNAKPEYGFVTRPHNGYWQIACYATDYGREFLTMPWQGKFATRRAAESFARRNVDCDY